MCSKMADFFSQCRQPGHLGHFDVFFCEPHPSPEEGISPITSQPPQPPPPPGGWASDCSFGTHWTRESTRCKKIHGNGSWQLGIFAEKLLRMKPLPTLPPVMVMDTRVVYCTVHQKEGEAGGPWTSHLASRSQGSQEGLVSRRTNASAAVTC